MNIQPKGIFKNQEEMNSQFSFRVHQGIPLLTYTPWWEEGIVHGMTLREMHFRGERWRTDITQLEAAIGVSHLALLHQTHSSTVRDVRIANEVRSDLSSYGDLIKRREGDAWVVANAQVVDGKAVAFGVQTADCVPIIVKGPAASGFAIIHAGWRGLAGGIIAKAVHVLGGAEEAVVFAAAGAPRYEVGMEVVHAIGDSCVAEPVGGDANKAVLDTAATAVKQLQFIEEQVKCEVALLCTISDARFHSYRRDGARAGRSVSFVVPTVV